MTIHANSVLAYQSLQLSDRCRVVLRIFMDTLQPMTDREAMQRLGFTDPNAVRPRITEMVESGWLEECGTAIDSDTKKAVRICRPTGSTISRVRAADPFRALCKVVAAYVANMAECGATDADILRSNPTIKPVDLPELLKSCDAFRAITHEVRRGVAVWFITKRGLVALGKDPANNWHADQPAKVSA